MNETRMDETRLEQMAAPLLAWYAQSARPLPWRADREPYHVWLSEILLQQTRLEVVRDRYGQLLAAAPDVFALAALPEERLLKLWEGLGYYSRARNLQKCARVLAARGGRFPETAQELQKLPGIGPYTAGAIASICFEQPAAAVDGNVLRVCARVLDDDRPVDGAAYRAALTAALEQVYPRGRCGDFTQALMELGQTRCTPGGAPDCARCPLEGLCLARAHATAAQRPVRSPKRPKREERYTVLLLRCDGRVAVERRPDRGLLAGLWQLPNAPGLLDERAVAALAAAWGLGALRPLSAREGKHVFTHIVWQLRCYTLACRTPSPRFTWVTPEQLADDYALPTAFRQFLN